MMLANVFIHYTGGDNASGIWYLEWSGFLPDLVFLGALGGLIRVVRHHNCHTKGCWRPGHKIEGTPYLLCHKHDPDHPGNSRNMSHRSIMESIKELKE